MADYAVPTDWREARRLVEQRLAEWPGVSRFQRLLVWRIVEDENVAAALNYIAEMQKLEVSDGTE